MPPPRCSPPLRPCLYARRAANGSRCRLSSLQFGDDLYSALRAQRQSQRSAGWWAALWGRKPANTSENESPELRGGEVLASTEGIAVRQEEDLAAAAEPSVHEQLRQLQDEVRRLREIISANKEHKEQEEQEEQAPSQSIAPPAETLPKRAPPPDTRTILKKAVRATRYIGRLAEFEREVRAMRSPALTPLKTQLEHLAYTRGAFPTESWLHVLRIDPDYESAIRASGDRLTKGYRSLRSFNRTIQNMKSPELGPLKAYVAEISTPPEFNAQKVTGKTAPDAASPSIQGPRVHSTAKMDDLQSTSVAEKPVPVVRRAAAKSKATSTEKASGNLQANRTPRPRPMDSRGETHEADFQERRTPEPDSKGREDDKVDELFKRPSGKKHQESQKQVSFEQKPEKLPAEEPRPSANGRTSEQSLLEELFPEATSYTEPHYPNRSSYPKVGLPEDRAPLVYSNRKAGRAQRATPGFMAQTEPLVALQLLHCSTELTEDDFRRLVPKGKHIDTWVRNGEFVKVIPGRDPLTLERLPFYYLIFKSTESALEYQKNASRLHKLSGLHQPSSILSAIPPPPGFLEDGEDLNQVLSQYCLKPTSLSLNMNMVMQPYNEKLRTLIQRGGYEPIVPSVNAKGDAIWKVLVHIEGYEPSKESLYNIFTLHANRAGLTWPFHGGINAFLRLRDVIDTRFGTNAYNAVASANPRAAKNPSALPYGEEDDDAFSSLKDLNLDPFEQSGSAKGSVSQIIMSRLYNRWIVEFEEEAAARRFARMWNRKVLPTKGDEKTWRDSEEVRMINTEVLW